MMMIAQENQDKTYTNISSNKSARSNQINLLAEVSSNPEVLHSSHLLHHSCRRRVIGASSRGSAEGFLL